MTNGITLPANIEQARTGAETLAKQAGELTTGQYTVGDVLKQKALDAYGASQDIIKPLDVATQEYLTAPQVAREKYADVFDPFARERLTAQYTGQQALPMLSLASILGQRFGRVEDVIGTGTRAYEAQTAAAGQAAQLGRQSYTDLLDEYQIVQQLAQQQWQRQFQESEAQRLKWQVEQQAIREAEERKWTEETTWPTEKAKTEAEIAGLMDLIGGGGGVGIPTPVSTPTPTPIDQELENLWNELETPTLTKRPAGASGSWDAPDEPSVGWSTPTGVTYKQPGTNWWEGGY